MPIDTNAAATTGLAAGLAANHELDEAVINSAKKRMVSVAEPLLKEIFEAKASAVRNITKRQDFVDGSAALAQSVRDAYDQGDEKALASISTTVAKYKASLLRAKKSR